MVIRSMAPSNVGAVAKLMSAIKPTGGTLKARISSCRTWGYWQSWWAGIWRKDGAPKGWLLCAEYAGYACLTIENLGYDENGVFVMEQQLEPLLQRAEQYARRKGLRNMRYIIGSTGMSCHGRPITDLPRSCARFARWAGRILTTSVPSVLCPPVFSPTATERTTTALSWSSLCCERFAVVWPRSHSQKISAAARGPGHPAPCFVLATVSVLPVHCGFDEALYL